mgnify:CR=1 FL=1
MIFKKILIIITEMNNSEKLLSESENRYVIFPIQHEPFWEMYKKAEANFWTTEELDLVKDIKDYNDYGYQIQETLPDGFYDWHHDFFSTGKESRFLTYLWYLNTVEEGGHTEFIDGTKIKPEMGKLILFPAAWPFYHRGTKPIREKKYICTGWLYVDSTCPNA